VCYFVTKSTGLIPVKPGMSSNFSETRDPSYSILDRPCVQNAPGRNGELSRFGLQSTPTGKRAKVCPRTTWRGYIFDLVWSRLGVGPAELSEIAVDREVFWVLIRLLPPRKMTKTLL